MLFLQLAPTFIAGILVGFALSPEQRRNLRWWIERQAKGDQHKDAEVLAKLKRRAKAA